jgi:hypothetical protein
VSYPLADGKVQFDSGQLGYGPQGYTAAAQRSEWLTPDKLPPGTYTYFCRVHPYMRGAFRVVGKPAGRTVEAPARARVRRGAVQVPVACRGLATGVCDGTLTLTRGGRDIGTGRIWVPAGGDGPVRVELARPAMRELARRRSLPVRWSAEIDGGSGEGQLVLKR